MKVNVALEAALPLLEHASSRIGLFSNSTPSDVRLSETVCALEVGQCCSFDCSLLAVLEGRCQVSDFRVLQDISLILRQILFEGMNGTEELGNRFTSHSNISLDSPAALDESNGAASSQVLLSLYLYQVLPDPHLNNRPLTANGSGQQHYPPLSLHLSYLLTPMSTSAEENLLIMGRSLQVLAAYPVRGANFLDSLLRPARPEMRITLNPLNLEEVTRLWNTFNRPYRLSACYEVHGVSIDSLRHPVEEEPVETSLVDVHQIMAEGGRSR